MLLKTGLLFPAKKAGKPVISDLVRVYDIEFNILQSKIVPGQTGRMIIELSGEDKAIADGLEYLKSQGVTVIELNESVHRVEEKCVNCGACTAVCPSGALFMNSEHYLELNQEACLICNACVAACPMRALISQEDKLNVDF